MKSFTKCKVLKYSKDVCYMHRTRYIPKMLQNYNHDIKAFVSITTNILDSFTIIIHNNWHYNGH